MENNKLYPMICWPCPNSINRMNECRQVIGAKNRREAMHTCYLSKCERCGSRVLILGRQLNPKEVETWANNQVPETVD